MKSMTKKGLAILFCSVILAVSITGCGKNSVSSINENGSYSNSKNQEEGKLENSESNQTDNVQNIRDIQAKTLDGEEVSGEVFAEHDITMINIWATYCGPCKAEMKDLGELAASLPEGANLISICLDGQYEAELAQQIMDKNNCKFLVLLPDEVLIDNLLNYVTAVPTTCFVDSFGNVVGDPIVGSRSKDDYRAELENLMEKQK